MFSSNRRVGLLTGTFDPVHLGHTAMARAAQSACELDEVWFLTNPAPEHKTGVMALEDRVAMVRLAVADEPTMREGVPAGGEVSVSHTIADFELMMSRYPATDFVFIVGADVLSSIDTWEDAARARVLQYAAARRAGADETLIDDLRVAWFDLAEHTGASSRRIQGELRAGKRPAELRDSVSTYIWERGLYKYPRN